MIKRSTLSDLLSYAYNETGLCDGDRIQRSIDGDPVVRTDYNELVKIINVLDDAKPEVSPEAIEKILRFC
jgi:hypothetical protein